MSLPRPEHQGLKLMFRPIASEGRSVTNLERPIERCKSRRFSNRLPIRPSACKPATAYRAVRLHSRGVVEVHIELEVPVVHDRWIIFCRGIRHADLPTRDRDHLA